MLAEVKPIYRYASLCKKIKMLINYRIVAMETK